jgi:hypothetical protein
MEKAESPKIPGTNEIDKGDKEEKGSFGTEDLWKKALKKFQDDNKIAAKEMEDLDLAGVSEKERTKSKKRLNSLRLGDTPRIGLPRSW